MDYMRLFWTLLFLYFFYCLEHVLCLSTGHNLPENLRFTYSRDFLLQLQLHPCQAVVIEGLPEEITWKGNQSKGNLSKIKAFSN